MGICMIKIFIILIRKLNHPDTVKFRQMYRLSNRGPLIQKMKIKNSCANHLAKSLQTSYSNEFEKFV